MVDSGEHPHLDLSDGRNVTTHQGFGEGNERAGRPPVGRLATWNVA